ncbi:MAG TPA: tetratricopeptide repeat protein [Kofleriaceae bacterium]
MNCPPSHELSRALSDGADPAIEAHLASCPSCTNEWAATARMIGLARELTAPLPSAAHREDVRSALLAASRTQSLTDSLSAPRRRVDRRVVIGAAAALAASVAIYLVTRPGVSVGHLHGSITALAGAQYMQVASTPDERVVLTEGSIDVQVSPLHRGERFRIILGDAEVEVHGTRFIVTAEHGSLVGVVVDHGVVEVRPQSGPTRMLYAGESWRPAHLEQPAAPTPPPVEEPAVQTAAAPSGAHLPAVRPARLASTTATEAPVASAPIDAPPATTETKPATADATPQEREYGSGWAAMRTGKFDDAATAFRKVLLLDPVGPLAEDATYWNAVALARSKQSPSAIAAFRDFLDQYPHAKRAGEGSAMLGWLLVSAGNRDEAVKRFRAAVDDADEAVRKSARAGLDALTIK